MTEPDFSKMYTREIFEWQYKNKPQVGEECELVGIEKQVWASTLHRSMVLQAENTKLKELLKEWVQFEIEENPNDFTVISERMSELANKTNQALGEK